VEPGIVFEQDPEAGTEADEGSTVTIVVSLGIAQREVPSVVGETVEDAQTILGEALFEVAVTEQASDEDEGIVISQSPEGGSQADRGSEVTIVVSSGPSTVAVPDVLCQSPSEAQAEIEDAELVYEESGEEFDTDCPSGTVSSQSPAPETQVAPGQTVRVTISLGASPSPSPSPTPTETPTA
jgi:serine/threonine-protein kinase